MKQPNRPGGFRGQKTKRAMQTSIHYTSGDCVTKVTPTIEALGDQIFHCVVFRHTRTESIHETFMVEADSRNRAAKLAQEKFEEKHGCKELKISEIIEPQKIER